jgi:hypothetical protein
METRHLEGGDLEDPAIAFNSMVRQIEKVNLSHGHKIAMLGQLAWMECKTAIAISESSGEAGLLKRSVDESSVKPLCQNLIALMCAAQELEAITETALVSAEVLVNKAIGQQADPNSYKKYLAELVEKEFLFSKGGRSGGYWLTEKGKAFKD